MGQQGRRAAQCTAPHPRFPLMSVPCAPQPGAETFLLGVCRVDPAGLEVAAAVRTVSGRDGSEAGVGGAERGRRVSRSFPPQGGGPLPPPGGEVAAVLRPPRRASRGRHPLPDKQVSPRLHHRPLALAEAGRGNVAGDGRWAVSFPSAGPWGSQGGDSFRSAVPVADRLGEAKECAVQQWQGRRLELDLGSLACQRVSDPWKLISLKGLEEARRQLRTTAPGLF